MLRIGQTGETMTAEQAKRLDDQEHKTLALWSADCAEHVLQTFEAQSPEADRPRKAIEATHAWVRRAIAGSEARAAAFAATA